MFYDMPLPIDKDVTFAPDTVTVKHELDRIRLPVACRLARTQAKSFPRMMMESTVLSKSLLSTDKKCRSVKSLNSKRPSFFSASVLVMLCFICTTMVFISIELHKQNDSASALEERIRMVEGLVKNCEPSMVLKDALGNDEFQFSADEDNKSPGRRIRSTILKRNFSEASESETLKDVKR